jgi:hypothetical protein
MKKSWISLAAIPNSRYFLRTICRLRMGEMVSVWKPLARGEHTMSIWSFARNAGGTNTRRQNRSTTFRLGLETLEGREVPSAAIALTATTNDATTAAAATPGPTATFSNNGPVAVNQPVTISFTNPSDPLYGNGPAAYTYAFDFGGGSFLSSPQTSVSSVTHTFSAPGTYTVYGRIYDLTGAFTQYSTTVTITGDGIYAVGAGPGSAPEVNVYDAVTHQLKFSFMAYDTGFTGGVHVAVADVNGDGIPDIITGAGPGGGPNVKVFDGNTGQQIASFFAYDPGFAGGVNVAAGDVLDNGQVDIITGAGPGGGPHVKVINGTQLSNLNGNMVISDSALIYSFYAYNPAFTGGVSVAAGELNGDGNADIVTGAGPGGGPNVEVFDGATGALRQSFMVFDGTYAGGVDVAVGNFLFNGEDIVVGQMTGASAQVQVYSGSSLVLLSAFSPFAAQASSSTQAGSQTTGQSPNGVNVAAMPDGSGHDDLIVGVGANSVSQVNVYDNMLTLLGTFEAFDPTFTGGVSVG